MKQKRPSLLLLFFVIIQITVAQNQYLKSANTEIQETLQKIVDSQDFAGVVSIVADGNSIKSLNCAGYQNLSKKINMNPNTLFWIASQSKPIAATAVMMLVDEGKLKLDEPIETYLPELKRIVVKSKWSQDLQEERKISQFITLRMLLSHTSGMKWVGGIQEQAGVIDILSLKSSVYVTAMTPLEVEPQKEFRYSNQGINVAAAIVERISGMSYDEFLRKRLFDPLGMKNTTFWPTPDQQKQLAVPYEKKDGVLQPATINQLQYPLEDKYKRYAEAAGGLFSTPIDLVKFYQLIANKGVYSGKRLLSEKSIIEMGTKQTGSIVGASYGLGWFVSDVEMSHAGSFGTDTRINKNSGLITMYFVQQKGLNKENSEAIRMFIQTAKQIYGDSK